MSGGACKAVIDNHQELGSLPTGWCLETLIRKVTLFPAMTDEIGRIYDSVEEADQRLAHKIQDALCSAQMDEGQQTFMRKFLLSYGEV